MPYPRRFRLVEVVLRCYSPKWRERHGEEAIQLAELLMRDGVSAVFIAWSYLRAAVRDRLVTRPRRRLGATAAALLVGATLIGAPLVLLDSFTPANAASGNGSFVVVLNRHEVVGQLKSVLKAHHFNIKVEVEPSSPSQIGAVLAIKTDGGEHGTLRVIRRPCAGRVSGCIDALVVPVHFKGKAEVIVGYGPKAQSPTTLVRGASER